MNFLIQTATRKKRSSNLSLKLRAHKIKKTIFGSIYGEEDIKLNGWTLTEENKRIFNEPEARI